MGHHWRHRIVNPEQTQTVLTSLARIEEATVHIKETSKRHEEALGAHAVRLNGTERVLARHRGIGTGVGSMLTLALAFVGIDRFWS
jgi:hypothetical protein